MVELKRTCIGSGHYKSIIVIIEIVIFFIVATKENTDCSICIVSHLPFQFEPTREFIFYLNILFCFSRSYLSVKQIRNINDNVE